MANIPNLALVIEVGSKEATPYSRLATLTLLLFKHQREQIHVGPGIFTRYPDPENRQDAELPPLGIDFAFNSESDGEGEFFLCDGEWCLMVSQPLEGRKHKTTSKPRTEGDNQMTQEVLLSVERRAINGKIKHISEKGWNHPQGHDRHLLSFPQEILDNILRHTLTTNKIIQPQFYGELGGPDSPPWSYKFVDCILGTSFSPLLTKPSGKSDPSTYNQWYHDLTLGIDSACLRVCSKFYFDGIDMLYENDFAFIQTNSKIQHHHGSNGPANLPAHVAHIEARLRTIDDLSSEQAKDLITYLDSILHFLSNERKRPGEKHDSFLWFLSKIGTDNAEKITNVRFYSLKHPENMSIMRYHLAFITQYCTGLHTLGLYSRKKKKSKPVLPAKKEVLRETTLMPLLKEQLRKIPSLRTLKVIELKASKLDDFLDQVWGPASTPEYAQETISWLAKQPARQHYNHYVSWVQSVEDAKREAAAMEESLQKQQLLELLEWYEHLHD